MKRQCTAKQLKALAKGRAIRRKNLKRKKPSTKRKTKRKTYKRPKKKRKMTKRRRVTGGLTGGTGDVNPQFYSGQTAQAVANTTLTIQYVLPVPRFSATQGRAVVLEILKVICKTDEFPIIANVAEQDRFQQVVFSTTNHGTVAATLNMTDVFAVFSAHFLGAFTATETYGTHSGPTVFTQDLTDGAGHGILIATDSFCVQVGSAGAAAALVARWKILYRFKRVPLAEYIGMVQSQQGA